MAEMTNIESESFNNEFCLHLEYHLGETFEKSGREEVRGFWCDGVSLYPLAADTQLSKKSVNDTRKIITTAWIGKGGHGKYEMTIHFGKYALRRYAKGTSLIDCIPSSDSMDWIEIDVKNKTIEIWLN